MIFTSPTSTNSSAISSITESPMPKRSTEVEEKESSGIGKIIIIVFLSITAVGFAALFVWKYLDWIDADAILKAEIKEAVSTATEETKKELEKDFTEREKTPYYTFAGPADYGELSFLYPKTWSVYIAKDAINGGDFEAYLNPGGVSPISQKAVFAIHVTIKTQSFDSAIKTYESNLKNGKLVMEVIEVNDSKSTANLYRGTLQNNFLGEIAVIKIRDKVAIIQTDSAASFENDFKKVLSSLRFNS